MTATAEKQQAKRRWSSAFPIALATGLLIVFAHACAGHRALSRPDVTPRLTPDAPLAAAAEAARLDPAAGAPLSLHEEVDHALSRVSFGARAEDRARVEGLGIAAYIEEQLHPEAIDDAPVEHRLTALPTLQESTSDRIHELAQFREVKKEEKERKARDEAAAQDGATMKDAAAMQDGAPMQDTAAKDETPPPMVAADASRPDASELIQTEAPAPAFPEHKRDRKTLGKIGRGPGFDFTLALAEGKLLRAVYSKRQLNEVMTDFWFNHFNIFAGKDRESALLPAYENDVIRAHALGSFRELLLATAHSPAMLIYLDNWRSTAADLPKRGKQAGKQKKGSGLNENYARELLELHTLGVDGGYTQADVTEVARCFTGWSVADPQTNPTFVFRPRVHDDGEKHVLGHVIYAGGGERDGDEVLQIILESPSAAHFLATKLVRRFVSDEPPPELVERVAQTYLSTLASGGDIRSMLRTIFESPEFWSRRALNSKMRSPLELVAASARALDANIDDPFALAKQIARIGEPLYAYAPPTGYGDTAATWTASGALLARIDFGLALAAGQLDGVAVDLTPLATGARQNDEVLARASKQLGAAALSDVTRNYVLEQLRDLNLQKRPELVAERAVGLLLGAPELQRR